MLLAGFDGGQTSTRCRLSTWHDGVWQTLGEGRGPGVTHLAAAQGQQRFRDAIRESFAEANQTCSGQAVAVGRRKAPPPMPTPHAPGIVRSCWQSRSLLA